MKRICFVSIFDLTILYAHLARHLEARGHQVFWMTTNPRWTAYLLSQGSRRENILELAFGREAYLDGDQRAGAVRAAVEAEQRGSRTISAAMLADQFVMDRNSADTTEIMLLYSERISEWLRGNQIDLVIAEPTNSNELVTNVLCESTGTPFIFPQTMRIPSDRFFFSRGVTYGEMVPVSNLPDRSEEHGRSASDIIGRFQEQPERPRYFALNNSAGAIDTKRVRQSLAGRIGSSFGGGTTHLTHHRTSERVRLTLRKVVNRTRMEHLTEYPDLPKLTGRLALFGLHVQPEQSIDVVGPFVSDQVKLIRDIRRSLPFDMRLLVKEHPNALGSKPWRDIEAIRKIPGVVLIDHRSSTFDLYKRVSLVFTVSGTTAYEAALLGTPAITFTRMYFGGLSSVYCCEDIPRLKRLVEDIVQHHRQNPDQDTHAMQQMLAHSFEGYWTDPLSDPAVLAPGNLTQLEAAFVTMVEHGRY